VVLQIPSFEINSSAFRTGSWTYSAATSFSAWRTRSTERDKLMLRTLADTGIRVGELVGLMVDDLVANGRQHFLRVSGKGSRERDVPVSPSLHARLQRYATEGVPSRRRAGCSWPCGAGHPATTSP
jgi:integrase